MHDRDVSCVSLHLALCPSPGGLTRQIRRESSSARDHPSNNWHNPLCKKTLQSCFFFTRQSNLQTLKISASKIRAKSSQKSLTHQKPHLPGVRRQPKYLVRWSKASVIYKKSTETSQSTKLFRERLKQKWQALKIQFTKWVACSWLAERKFKPTNICWIYEGIESENAYFSMYLKPILKQLSLLATSKSVVRIFPSGR